MIADQRLQLGRHLNGARHPIPELAELAEKLGNDRCTWIESAFSRDDCRRKRLMSFDVAIDDWIVAVPERAVGCVQARDEQQAGWACIQGQQQQVGAFCGQTGVKLPDVTRPHARAPFPSRLVRVIREDVIDDDEGGGL